MNWVPEKCCFGPHQYVSPVNKFASRQANGLVWRMLRPRVRISASAIHPVKRRQSDLRESRVHRVELVRLCGTDPTNQARAEDRKTLLRDIRRGTQSLLAGRRKTARTNDRAVCSGQRVSPSLYPDGLCAIFDEEPCKRSEE